MAFETTFVQEGQVLDYTAQSAVVNGQIIQLPDGRAAQIKANAAAGASVGAQVSGVIECAKTENIAILAGGDVFWVLSTNKANFKPTSGTGDFFLGTAVQTAAASDSTVLVALNQRTRYDIAYGVDQAVWRNEEQTGTGASFLVIPGGATRLALSNANEAQQIAVAGTRGVRASAHPIVEIILTRMSASNNTVDIDVGLASGTDGTDFQSVTAFAAFHLDGGDNLILTHSDDGVTDRAPAASGFSDVDGTPVELWMDFADPTDIKFYVEGELVNTTSAKRTLAAALTTALYPTLMVEKTAGTATAEINLTRLRVRTNQQE